MGIIARQKAIRRLQVLDGIMPCHIIAEAIDADDVPIAARQRDERVVREVSR
jgi:hypothetical protein